MLYVSAHASGLSFSQSSLFRSSADENDGDAFVPDMPAAVTIAGQLCQDRMLVPYFLGPHIPTAIGVGKRKIVSTTAEDNEIEI